MTDLTKAHWIDGEPANLAAAAMDAAEWLDVIESVYAYRMDALSRKRFNAARKALKHHIAPFVPTAKELNDANTEPQTNQT